MKHRLNGNHSIKIFWNTYSEIRYFSWYKWFVLNGHDCLSEPFKETITTHWIHHQFFNLFPTKYFETGTGPQMAQFQLHLVLSFDRNFHSLLRLMLLLLLVMVVGIKRKSWSWLSPNCPSILSVWTSSYCLLRSCKLSAGSSVSTLHVFLL